MLKPILASVACGAFVAILFFASLTAATSSAAWDMPSAALASLILTSLLPLGAPLVFWLAAVPIGWLYGDQEQRSKAEGIVAALTVPWIFLMAYGTICYLIASYDPKADPGTAAPSWFMLFPLVITTAWMYGSWISKDKTATSTRLWTIFALGVMLYVALSHWTPYRVETEIGGSKWGAKVVKGTSYIRDELIDLWLAQKSSSETPTPVVAPTPEPVALAPLDVEPARIVDVASGLAFPVNVVENARSIEFNYHDGTTVGHRRWARSSNKGVYWFDAHPRCTLTDPCHFTVKWDGASEVWTSVDYQGTVGRITSRVVSK